MALAQAASYADVYQVSLARYRGPDHTDVGIALGNLADVYMQVNDLARAESRRSHFQRRLRHLQVIQI